MIYRLRRRISKAHRLLTLPALGMMLAVSVSGTKAWAPGTPQEPVEPYVVVLR